MTALRVACVGILLGVVMVVLVQCQLLLLVVVRVASLSSKRRFGQPRVVLLLWFREFLVAFEIFSVNLVDPSSVESSLYFAKLVCFPFELLLEIVLLAFEVWEMLLRRLSRDSQCDVFEQRPKQDGVSHVSRRVGGQHVFGQCMEWSILVLEQQLKKR